MNKQRYMLKVIKNKIVYIEENKNGNITRQFDNTNYGSGISFIKDVAGIDLDKEPSYDEMVEILDKVQD
jgi:pterin-4a-carbinolamine dehydratase